MAQRHRFNKTHNRRPHAPRAAAPERTPPVIYAPKPPVEYGKPIVILEDVEKRTYEYRSGAWVPYPLTIAACRAEGEVKELPQKINKMTRYEVRLPLSHTPSG